MQRHKIAWHLGWTSLAFMGSVMRCIPPEMLDIFVNGEEHPLKDRLRSDGYTLYPWSDPLPVGEYEFWVLDQAMFNILPSFREAQAQGQCRCCCLQHSVDQRWMPTGGTYSIRAHKYLAQPQGSVLGVYCRDEQPLMVDKVCALPPQSREEFAYTGPYHVEEWLTKRHLPRQDKLEILESVLGRKLPADKPVVAFFLDEISSDADVIHGLKALGKDVSIIYKGYHGNDSRPLTLGRAVIPWPSVDYAPNTLRFCADHILAGYNSGTLASSVMLGLRVLPYFTRQVYYAGRNAGLLGDWASFLPQSGADADTSRDCLGALGRAFDILGTKGLLQGIHDESFWADYRERLPQIHSQVFGDFQVEGAAQKTAALIVRAFRTGTFGKDAVAVRLNPAWLEQHVL